MAEPAERTDLAEILAGVAAGRYPDPGGRLTVLPQPSDRDAGVLAFSGHAVVFADLDPAEVAALAGGDADANGYTLPDLSAPLNPPFLTALATRAARRVNNIDQLMLATPPPGPPSAGSPSAGGGLPGPASCSPSPGPLAEVTQAPGRRVPDPAPAGLPLALKPVRDASAHPRLARARRYRDDVRAWRAEGGLLILGRGVAGRWEVAVEVDEDARGRGIGRAVAATARRLVPDGEPLWAQVAPANAAGVRAFAAAGFVPVGAEALLVAHHA